MQLACKCSDAVYCEPFSTISVNAVVLACTELCFVRVVVTHYTGSNYERWSVLRDWIQHDHGQIS